MLGVECSPLELSLHSSFFGPCIHTLTSPARTFSGNRAIFLLWIAFMIYFAGSPYFSLLGLRMAAVRLVALRMVAVR